MRSRITLIVNAGLPVVDSSQSGRRHHISHASEVLQKIEESASQPSLSAAYVPSHSSLTLRQTTGSGTIRFRERDDIRRPLLPNIRCRGNGSFNVETRGKNGRRALRDKNEEPYRADLLESQGRDGIHCGRASRGEVSRYGRDHEEYARDERKRHGIGGADAVQHARRDSSGQ